MSGENDGAPSLTVNELFGEAESRAQRARNAARRAAAEAAAQFEQEKQNFLARPLTEANRQLFLRRIRTEFEHHEREVMLASFPSDYCEDGGRHINHQLPGWEDQLPGYARRVYEFWRDDLRLGGFEFHARVISFSPQGIPQDIGLFISWPDTPLM